MRRYAWLALLLSAVACKASPSNYAHAGDAGAGHKLGSTIYVPTPATLPPSAGGDLAAGGIVQSISGPSPIAITPNSLQWIAGATAPAITQASESTAIKGADVLAQPQQSTHATDQGGGNWIHNFQPPAGVGAEAGLLLTRGGVQFGKLTSDVGPNLNVTAAQGMTITAAGASLFLVSTNGSDIYRAASHLLQSANGSLGFLSVSASGISSPYPFGGLSNLPYQEAATAGALSTAANITLSNAQLMTQLIQLNGTTQAGETLTVPNVVGGKWCFDFTGVTLGANTVTVGTATPTTSVAIGSTSLVGALKTICCRVFASNVVSCGGG